MRLAILGIVLSTLLLLGCQPVEEGGNEGALAGEAVKVSAPAPSIPSDFTGKIYEKCEDKGDEAGANSNPLVPGSVHVGYQEYNKGKKIGMIKVEVLWEKCLTPTTLLEYTCAGSGNDVYFREERIDCSKAGLACVDAAESLGGTHLAFGAACT